jgi:hypothetical protein
MPRTDEQLQQIETALRNRFFPLVPRVDKAGRENWPTAQHDTDRLTRSLAAFTVANLAGVDDTTATGAITDGDDDFGIDALYYDRARPRLLLVQSKFKRGGAAPSQDENLKTINGVRALMARRFSEFNGQFQSRLDEIEEALDTPGVVLHVVLVFLGQTLGRHVTNDLDGLKTEINAPGTRMGWEWHGLSGVHGWLLAEQVPSAVTIESLTLDHWALIPGPPRAVYGQLSAATLVELVQAHGTALFERNIRHYLGSVSVNSAIAETASRRPADLFYLNNGLTSVAGSITPAAGTADRCNFRLTDFSVVNGAQTAGALAAAAMAGPLSTEARVFLTIIEIGGLSGDICRRITKARNYQTAVRGVDFAALDPHQERLRQELAVSGVTYHYRPSAEARVRRDDAFGVEEAAIALACLSLPVLTSQEVQDRKNRGHPVRNAVDHVVMAKREIGRLWDQDGPAYGVLFSPTLSAALVCRAVRIHRFADQVLADTERAEASYYRRMFFRHGRFFTMAFLANRCSGVLRRPDLHLSDPDKVILSRSLNELAELIYAESVPLQGIKGYLAIFRNLTESQPLADRVMARLTERDRSAAQPPPPTQPLPES